MKWDTVTTSSFHHHDVMLIGEYTHRLDDKNRLSFPAKFRTEAGKKIVITRGLDTCLFVYPMASWKKIFAKFGALPMGQEKSRKLSRFFIGGAVEAEIDSAGRLLVPDFLRDFAGLKDRVVIAGVYDRIELWDEKKWETYKKGAVKEADDLAEQLGDVGMI